jgi:hypothetical protein
MIRSAALSAVALVGCSLVQSASAQWPRPIVVEHPVIVHPQPACPVYTLDTFARDFRPVEGHHRILVVHPVTKCPVEVCFELPCGKLKEFDVNRRSIEFDYGKHEVRLIFRLNGKVDVKSN